MSLLQAVPSENVIRPLNMGAYGYDYRSGDRFGKRAAMNGADAVVFAGGIGENSWDVRARICDGLQWAGLELDGERNRAQTGGHEGLIS